MCCAQHSLMHTFHAGPHHAHEPQYAGTRCTGFKPLCSMTSQTVPGIQACRWGAHVVYSCDRNSKYVSESDGMY